MRCLPLPPSLSFSLSFSLSICPSICLSLSISPPPHPPHPPLSLFPSPPSRFLSPSRSHCLSLPVSCAGVYGRGHPSRREFFIDNLLVRIHFIIVMIRWTGLAPREFEFPFPGSLTSTFLFQVALHLPSVSPMLIGSSSASG